MENKDYSLIPVDAMQKMAETVAKSKLFPSAPTTEAAFALMLLCQSEGLHPMQAMRRYHIIQGRASMKAEAILAVFMERGGKVEWRDYANDKVTGIFEAPGLLRPVAVTWTMADATKAKLAGKDNYVTYPRQMLRARVISDGVRMAMPAVMVGILSAEEAEDLAPLHPAAPRRTSEVTAEVVDTPPTQPEVTETAPDATATPGGAPTEEVKKITEKEALRFWNICLAAKKTEEQVKTYLADTYGIESMKYIPASDYNQACAWAAAR